MYNITRTLWYNRKYPHVCIYVKGQRSQSIVGLGLCLNNYLSLICLSQHLTLPCYLMHLFKKLAVCNDSWSQRYCLPLKIIFPLDAAWAWEEDQAWLCLFTCYCQYRLCQLVPGHKPHWCNPRVRVLIQPHREKAGTLRELTSSSLSYCLKCSNQTFISQRQPLPITLYLRKKVRHPWRVNTNEQLES